MTAPLAAPFPYFGGKRRAAPLIWQVLGDPGGYVEPFCGSAAVLLARPPFKGRRVETINDADGWLVNMWRAIRYRPGEVAAHVIGPVTEIDYHARLAWLQERRTDGLVSWLEGDPEVCDPKAAAWWLYVMAAGIGDPFGPGPWRVVDGRLRKGKENPGQGVNRALPHLGDPGRGVNRELPHLGNPGRGVNSYFSAIAARLARVRITCGDWRRVLTPAASRARTGGDGTRAIFLDPPYSTSGDLYAHGDHQTAADVREWCAQAPTDTRIVLCGYDEEHDSLGWRKVEGKSGSGAGYSTRSDNGRRERLWLSPACLDPLQEDLFTFLGDDTP